MSIYMINVEKYQVKQAEDVPAAYRHFVPLYLIMEF